MKNQIKKAIETIHDMSELVTEHAVEEEARIMRVIMHNAKKEPADSIKKIIWEHTWVVDFLKHKIPNIECNIFKQNKQVVHLKYKNLLPIGGITIPMKNRLFFLSH